MTSTATLQSIADALRVARERAGYTLDELAARTGLSKPHLSRLESAERQPSIAALLTLARALRTPLSQLLGETTTTISPLGLFEAEGPARSSNGLSIAPCSGYDGSRLLDAARITVDPDRDPPVPARHMGEEWIHVLSGTLRLEYGSEVHELSPGQSAHFDAEKPHRLGATGAPAEIILVAVDVPGELRRIHR